MNLFLFFFCLISFFAEAKIGFPKVVFPKKNTLHEAVYNGDIKTVKALIKKGVDVNDRIGEREIEERSIVGYFNYISTGSFKSGLNPDLKEILNVLKEVPDRKWKETKNGTTALHWIKDDNVEIAKLLIENGANVNFSIVASRYGYNVKFNKDGSSTRIFPESTPLHVAFLNNHLKIAKLLIENGADVNARYKSGKTLLHEVKNIQSMFLDVAFLNNHLKNIKFLIDNVADVNARDKSGKTPLHEIRNTEIAKLLIENGADVNVKDKMGVTPLHYPKNEEIAKFLIDNGANVKAINNKGQTPCDTISSEKVKKLIKEKGACSFTLVPKKIWYKVRFFLTKKDRTE